MSEYERIPTCIGFIMDGNRRWAKERGLPTVEGHRKGHETLKQLITWVRDAGIQHMVCYAFSTENWNRDEEEISYLMSLFREAVANLREEQKKEKVRVRFIGQRTRFPEDLQRDMDEVEGEAPKEAALTVWIALSYGGRAEIVHAVNQIVEKGESVSEESFGAHLWTAGMPDPDLIIRTGGEQRLSNFLTWQSVYSELHFTKTPWPAFGQDEFFKILHHYSERNRNFGS